jgi:hypothetical protein
MALHWEKVDEDGINQPSKQVRVVVQRARLPHGWLIRTLHEHIERTEAQGVPPDIEVAASVGIAFVPLGPEPWN